MLIINIFKRIVIFLLITNGCYLFGITNETIFEPFKIPDTLYYKEHIHWHKSPGFGIDGNNESDSYSQTWIQKNKWRFQQESDNKIPFLFETFDGVTHRWFHRTNGRLFITAKDEDIWLSRVSYISCPFIFLLDSKELAETRSGQSGGCTIKRLPGILNMSDSAKWKDFITKSHFVDYKNICGQKCLLYRFDPEVYNNKTNFCRLPDGDKMEIAISQDKGDLPIELRWFDRNGTLLLSSEITDIQEILVESKKFYFPKNIHIKKFFENGKLYQENSISITDIKVNNPVADETFFMLDPLISKQIVDEKNGVCIDVR
jgi:hypothetical protein